MVETLSVSLSGPAFSLLLYENVRTNFNQEGFLLGEIVEKATNSITDNDEQVTKIDRVIKINSAVPCPQIGYFYDGAGKVDTVKITNFLGDESNKLVAWYKFRRSHAFRLTVLDKVVHKQLAKHFGRSQELFTCCLLTSSWKRNAATHLYSQTFVRYNEPTFQNVPMHIRNLSDPSNLYKSPEPCSVTFNNLFKSLNINPNKSQGLNVITKINISLQKRTDEVVIELVAAEKELVELEEEVKMLKEKTALLESTKEQIIENGNGDLMRDDVSPLESTEPVEETDKDELIPIKKTRNAKKAVKSENFESLEKKSRSKGATTQKTKN